MNTATITQSTHAATIETAYASQADQWTPQIKTAILETIEALDSGNLRIAEKINQSWQHHSWVQKAILCYFKLTTNTSNLNTFLPYKDKIDSKFQHKNLDTLNCRVVPPTHVRYGAYLGEQCVLMPCFINIGAYIDDHSMIDTWATIGSGAQIGKNVHISGGVGIGGVLEPPQAKPTIIEDNCFIGARSEIAEGVHIQEGAVIAMGTFISQSTKIYDRTTGQYHQGVIPKNAVVVPGSIPAKDNSHQLSAAIIVKYADAQTRMKTGINEILRDF